MTQPVSGSLKLWEFGPSAGVIENTIRQKVLKVVKSWAKDEKRWLVRKLIDEKVDWWDSWESWLMRKMIDEKVHILMRKFFKLPLWMDKLTTLTLELLCDWKLQQIVSSILLLAEYYIYT